MIQKETYLIVADGYDTVATMQSKPRRVPPSFDVELLRRWLKYLKIRHYDVCWSRDEKLKTWTGPVLALGDNAHAAAVKLGKRVYKLPHPSTHSTTIKDPVKMRAILDSVHKKMLNRPEYVAEKKLKVIK